MRDDFKLPKKEGKGRRRISVPIDNRPKKASVSALRFEDMIITDGKDKRRFFNRLCYIGVPIVEKIVKGEVTLAGRDVLVRQLYDLAIKQYQSPTLLGYFDGLVSYFKYLDANKYKGGAFDNEIMSKCIKYYNAQGLKGKDISMATRIQFSLSQLLPQLQRSQDVRFLPIILSREPSTKLVAFDIEKELKHISRVLIKGFRGFIAHIKANTHPDTHPMYIEELLIKQSKINNWTNNEFVNNKYSFKASMRVLSMNLKEDRLDKETLRLQLLANQAGRNALYVFYMLTGMNRDVLASMHRSDVHFKDIDNGRYVFNSKKGRAHYKDLDNGIGFSKRTKDLIEEWLEVSQLMYQRLGHYNIDTLPLIPYFESFEGEVLDFTYHKANPERINRQIEKLLGLNVNSTRFRKTKSDILMRVTEDMLLVSLGLNNSIQVVSRTYSSGVKSDHDNNLNATFIAQYSVAKGLDISEAISEAKVLHSDILSDYDYKERLRKNKKTTSTITPTGIHCQGATPEKLAIEIKKLAITGVDLSNDEHKCTDFMACFSCKSHLLIASERDIWLMLSFLEQIIGLKEHVSMNSIPKKYMFEVEALLTKTLGRLKTKSPHNYNKALKNIEHGVYHPLYSNRSSLRHFFGE